MTSSTERDLQEYDIVFIGTSVVCILEAVYRDFCGEKVLMVEKADKLGGAWKTLEIFGYENVENAIHYLLPDKEGFKFLTNSMNMGLEPSTGKYRLFENPILGMKKVSYDNVFSGYLGEVDKSGWKLKTFKVLFNSISQHLKGKKGNSVYFKNGCSELLSHAKSLLSNSKIEVFYSSNVNDIFFDKGSKKVNLTINKNDDEKQIVSKKLCVTHGSKITELRDNRGSIKVNNKKIYRPAVHLLVEDNFKSDIFEGVFTNNKLIKYCHDITRFCTPLKRGQKVFVFALWESVNNYEGVFNDLFNIIKSVEIVGPKSQLLDGLWWDVFLPPLFDEDLELLEKEFGEQVFTLKTENFSRAMGLYGGRWSSKIPPVKQSVER
ncbi:MAG: hypothetical protein HN576_14375 [Bacteriovoracaceae bacterium]|jgi:hypothetical protein|nr:hypothetical protein [Bacteriovoracaceae bacterium]